MAYRDNRRGTLPPPIGRYDDPQGDAYRQQYPDYRAPMPPVPAYQDRRDDRYAPYAEPAQRYDQPRDYYPPPPRQHDYYDRQPKPVYAPGPPAQVRVDYSNPRDPRDSGREKVSERKYPSAPSQSVIFVGLPQHVTDDILRMFLENMGAYIDNTTIILDRETGQSKKFGFARFASAEHARAFVEPNFPSVIWREPSGLPDLGFDGLRIKIDFSQTDKGPKAEKRGAYSDRPPPPDSKTINVVNDGMRHIGQRPSRFLLLRGLDSLTVERDVAEILRDMLMPDRDSPSPGLQRVMLAKDRSSHASWGFAFVEFVDQRAAMKALKDINSPQINPRGFRIGNAAVGATFCQNETFRPTYTPNECSFQDYISGKDLVYSDTAAYLSIYQFPDIKRFEPNHAAKNGPQISAQPSKNEDDAFLDSLDRDTSASPQNNAAKQTGDKIDNVANVKINTIVMADSIASKKSTAKIDHWNRKKQESESDLPPMASASSYSAPAQTVDQYPYADTDKFQCLLCLRQFKGIDTLDRHNKESDLHKTNLQDASKRELATSKKAALAPTKQPSELQYRDRAAERRIALGQPDEPELALHGSRKRARPEPEPFVQPNRDGIAEDNRGRRMLEASGWNKGEGFGSGGRTDIVEARQYTPGAGLGASTESSGQAIGGADKYHRPSEYGRERARARYQ